MLVEDRMFSTLSTTTSRLKAADSDTIGFISNLPHFMIESFKAPWTRYLCRSGATCIDSSDDEEPSSRS